ncbi:Golgi complex component 7-domain-containing protein [Umbelopsis sp. PMI_123]|nr:Golgi complex component 7-domain-containing protein [Umbelopsis sp. PMI_123]
MYKQFLARHALRCGGAKLSFKRVSCTRGCTTTSMAMADLSINSEIPDVESFSKPEFNVKSWINHTIRSVANDNGQPLTNSAHMEEQTNVMVTRLQLLGSQVSQQVSQTTDGVIQSIPLVMYDMQLMKNQVASIKSGIEAVRRDMNDDKNGNRSAIQRLRQLDLVKTRMEQCRTALRETENWSNLEQETRATIETGEYAKAAAQLASAQKSISVFQNTPDYEKRKNLLSQLQEELKTAIRPQLDLALKEHDAVTCHNLYNVCAQIALPEAYLDAYFEYCQKPIVQLWESANLIEEYSDATTTFEEFLSNFFKESFILISEEYNWCRSVFPDPREAMQAFVQYLFLNLSPTFGDRISKVQTYYESDSLAHMANLFQVTEGFGLSLERLFSKSVVAAAENEPPSGHRRSNSISARRKSQQMMSLPLALRTSTHSEQEGWSYVFYDPFLQVQSQFGEIQKKQLEAKATALVRKLEAKRGGLDISQILTFKSSDAFDLAQDAIDVCLKLTHGFAAAGLLKDLNDYFVFLTNQLLAMISKLNQEESDKRIEPINDTSLSDDDDDLAAIQDQGDWSRFQNGLRLLAICKTMSQDLSSFEAHVQHSLETVRDIVEDKEYDDRNSELVSPKSSRPPSIGPFSGGSPSREQKRSSGHFEAVPDKLIRRQSASFKQSLMAEHSNTRYPKSSVSLLRSSALNSFELHRLMSSISMIAEEESEQTSTQIRFLAPANQAISSFALACQTIVFNVVLNPVTDNFSKMAEMNDIWTADAEEDGYEARAADSIELPQFSQAPSEYITRVGEQLLILPQQFEVYADDEALAFMIDKLPYIQKDQPVDQDASSQDETADQVNVEFDNGVNTTEDMNTSVYSEHSTITTAPPLSTVSERPISPQEDLLAEEILQKWTLAICHGTMKSLVDHISADIRALSPQGSQQLRVDIEYMVNVLSALDVRPSPTIIQLHMLLGLNDSELSDRLKEDKDDDDKLLQRVARLRGIQLLKL